MKTTLEYYMIWTYFNYDLKIDGCFRITFVSEIIIGERAKRARHYQGCTNSSLCGTYIYIYIYMYGGTYAIIVAHATHT